MLRRDPLANPEPLIRRIYRYVSYRVGDGAEAEDITSEVFERALRYRESYDSSRGDPAAWLIGIAQRCIAGASRPLVARSRPGRAGRLRADGRRRAAAADAQGRPGDARATATRSSWRFGTGPISTARQIADVLELKVNAVEVGLHRALARLREILESEGIGAAEELLASL